MPVTGIAVTDSDTASHRDKTGYKREEQKRVDGDTSTTPGGLATDACCSMYHL